MLSRSTFLREEVWRSVLKADQDGPLEDFILSPEFNVVVTCAEGKLPTFVAEAMWVLKVDEAPQAGAPAGGAASGANGEEGKPEDPLEAIASIMGASEVIRYVLFFSYSFCLSRFPHGFYFFSL